MSADNLNWRQLPSSHVHSAAYDEEEHALYVRFTDDSEYKYAGVERLYYEELMNSVSPGGYMRDVIKPIFGLAAERL